MLTPRSSSAAVGVVVAAIVAVTASSPVPPVAGLWALEDGSGVTATDTSGNGNTGTLVNGPAWVSGKVGGALAFDGVNDYVTPGDPVALRPSFGLTMASWVQLTDASVTRVILAKDDALAPNNATYLRYQSGGKVGCGIGGTQLLAGSGIIAGQWYHLACTYDGAMMRAYVNGALVGQVARTGAIADEIGVAWLIGARRPSSPAIFMAGRLDDVRVYQSALTTAEIAGLYSNAFVCGDGLDNDSDGLFDYPADPGCATANDDDESNDPFQTPSSWATFDANAAGVGQNPIGFNGAVFDGRFVYFVPFLGRSEVLRYDTQQAFSAVAAWAAFDPNPPSGGGYAGGAFDGRYVYFAPWGDNSVAHGEVLRYDTQGAFGLAASWQTFSPGNAGVGTDPRGYWGAFFDGQFVYFAPEWKQGGEHGEVLRFDTTASFTVAASWQTYDAGAHGLGTAPRGYKGIASDGRYLYFVPYLNSTGSHGEVLRYDRQGAFQSLSFWATFTPANFGVGVIAKGFEGAVFDGRWIYFVPSYSGTGPGAYHGEVLRYDTQAPFTTAASWGAFDPGAAGLGVDPDGYNDAVFAGGHLYFVPTNNGSGAHGEVLRFDPAGSFTNVASWRTFIPGSAGVGVDPRGYAGAAFDGRYIYFAPDRKVNVWTSHGEVLRYDICPACG